ALKSLNDSSNFLKEAYYECQSKSHDVEKYGTETYGITYAPDEEDCSKPDKNKYVMVLEYADQGNLRTYLSKKENFTNLSWKQKIEILCSISNNLNHIHNISHLCHRDLHSGNILMTSAADLENLRFSIFTVGSKIVLVSRNITGERLRIEPKITDFGLSSKVDELSTITHGNLPYVAPEIIEELDKEQLGIRNKFLEAYKSDDSTSFASSQQYQRIDASIIA
ncbi:19889_t:CDS:2, partial [Racocetra fulgida]